MTHRELVQRCELVILMHALSRANRSYKLDQFQTAYLKHRRAGWSVREACDYALSDCELYEWHGWN